MRHWMNGSFPKILMIHLIQFLTHLWMTDIFLQLLKETKQRHSSLMHRLTDIKLQIAKNIFKLRGFLSISDPEKWKHSKATVQSVAACILTGTKKSQHITLVLKSRHWLPIKTKVDFKNLLLVYKALHGLTPQYITDILINYSPARTLRSTSIAVYYLSGPISLLCFKMAVVLGLNDWKSGRQE